MENEKFCFICQDFEINIGHETKWCPKNSCKKCGENGHTKVGCMFGWENLPIPNEILFKIFSYLSIKDLGQCAQVSKRIREICQNQDEWILGYLCNLGKKRTEERRNHRALRTYSADQQIQDYKSRLYLQHIIQ